VNYTSNTVRIVHKCEENIQLIGPRLHFPWVLARPFRFKLSKHLQCDFFTRRSINEFQILRHFELVFFPNTAEGVTDFVNDTTLYVSFRINRPKGFLQPRKAIEDAQKHFLDASFVELLENLPPSIGAFLSSHEKIE